jgi:MFS family permease
LKKMIRDFKSVLNNKNFLYLWASQIFSQLTINIMNFLLIIKLFETTKSSLATSMLWVAYALPAIFIGPIGAASVDFWDKRKILIITNLFQALTIFIFAFLHESRGFLIYGVVMAYSFLNQFYVPAEASSVPFLVEKESLPQSNSLFFFTQQGSLIFGFGFAGLILKFLGFEKSLYLCAALVFLAFISTMFLPQIRVRDKTIESFEQAIGDFFGAILDGYKLIKEQRKVLIPLLLLGGLQVTLAILVVNLPVLATQVFKIGVEYAGIFLIVPCSIGAILGAIVSSKLLKSGWRKKKVIEKAMVLMTISVFTMAFVVPFIPGLLGKFISFLVVVATGLAFVAVFIPTQTFLQEVTPHDFRGRVFGNFSFLVTIATIFPVIFSGTVIEIFGAQVLLFMLGALALTVIIYSRKLDEGLLEMKNG